MFCRSGGETNECRQTRVDQRALATSKCTSYRLTVRPIVAVECQRRSVAETLSGRSRRKEHCRHRQSFAKCLLICLHDDDSKIVVEIYESIDPPHPSESCNKVPNTRHLAHRVVHPPLHPRPVFVSLGSVELPFRSSFIPLSTPTASVPRSVLELLASICTLHASCLPRIFDKSFETARHSFAEIPECIAPLCTISSTCSMD